MYSSTVVVPGAGRPYPTRTGSSELESGVHRRSVSARSAGPTASSALTWPPGQRATPVDRDWCDLCRRVAPVANVHPTSCDCASSVDIIAPGGRALAANPVGARGPSDRALTRMGDRFWIHLWPPRHPVSLTQSSESIRDHSGTMPAPAGGLLHVSSFAALIGCHTGRGCRT